MPDLTFRQLAHATRIVSAETMYFNQVSEWEAKRKTLEVQLSDFPSLIKAHLDRTAVPYGLNEKISIVDMVPTTRLANACEATANGVYSAAEVAANFANKATKGLVPRSFNALRKKCEENPSTPLATALGDLQWYRKVREIRTEWTHYSSIFIAHGDNEEVMLCVRGFRGNSDKREFTTANFSCAIDDFLRWVRGAMDTLDRFASHLLEHHVLPQFDLDQTFTSAVTDSNGYPIIRPDHRFEIETITIREYLARAGIPVGA